MKFAPPIFAVLLAIAAPPALRAQPAPQAPKPATGSTLLGDIRVHDPSTVVRSAGRYWVLSTGRGISVHVSDDGVTWRRTEPLLEKIPDSVRQFVPENNGLDVWAPDVTVANDACYVYYSVSKWMGPHSAIGLITSPSLDPSAPGYRWTDRGVVVHSDTGEGMDAIDPGVLRGPDGRWWLTYGSYRGTVNVIELDPHSGLRRAGANPSTPLANHAEASDLIAHDGWYFLLINRGSCCQGPRSTYRIMIGRSRDPRGPFRDREGRDLLTGGGDTFLATRAGRIGPGHFGRLVDQRGEWFSCHYEADAAHGNRPAFDLLPLRWTDDGWPAAGERRGPVG